MDGKAGPHALSSREKMHIWQELKVLSFTRTMSSMWAVSLLDLFVRIQLNILGRHVYVDTARDAASAAPDPVAGSSPDGVHRPLSMSCQHKFIAFADYLPHKGLEYLVRDVRSVVEGVMRSKPLKEPYRLADLRDLVSEIRHGFESRGPHWADFVLPEDNSLPQDLAAASLAADEAKSAASGTADEAHGSMAHGSDASDDGAMLEELMIETRGMLSSSEFEAVLAVAFDAITEAMLGELRETVGDGEAGVPLAKLLPPVASIGGALMEHPEENSYIALLADLPQVQSFCAMVYTSVGGSSAP
eukprot:SM000028S10134  [mRNA]  locus=s28:520617:522236:- [translate_table: standard]